jgi:hypothetical protein
MNNYRALVCGAVVFGLAGCAGMNTSTTDAEVGGHAQMASARGTDNTCSKTQTQLIPAALLNGRRLLGDVNYQVTSRSVNDSGVFETVCDVTLSQEAQPPSPECHGNSNELVLKDKVMKITKAGDAFTMLLSGGGVSVKVTDMHARRFLSTGTLSAGPPIDFLHGTDGVGREFFVYFEDSLGPGYSDHPAISMAKLYWVQLYYPDVNDDDKALCNRHRPDTLVVDGYMKQPSRGSGQGGVGGGTEPRH